MDSIYIIFFIVFMAFYIGHSAGKNTVVDEEVIKQSAAIKNRWNKFERKSKK